MESWRHLRGDDDLPIRVPECTRGHVSLHQTEGSSHLNYAVTKMNRLLRTSAKGMHADGGNVAAVSLSTAES